MDWDSPTPPRGRPLSPSPDELMEVGPPIKTEAEVEAHANLNMAPCSERVSIHVGKKNKCFLVGLHHLAKSRALKAMVSHSATKEPYIIHPLLTRFDPNHFQSVYHFLLLDEYVPCMLDHPGGPDKLPKQLAGLSTVEDYRNEARRATHVYVLAKALGMTALEDLTYRKITQVQHHMYGINCLLGVAKTAFSRALDNDLPAEGEGPRQEHGDRLEEWLIDILASKFQLMMILIPRKFFQLADHGASAERQFAPRVLERKVRQWEALGDAVVVEDNE